MLLLKVNHVVQVVAVTNFLGASESSLEALKTANLLKSLSVNALVLGAPGTGKKTLSHYILPDTPIFDAKNFDELLIAIASNSSIIINHIESSPNIQRLFDEAKRHGTRVIATCSDQFIHPLLEEVFPVQLILKPLSERAEDITLLQKCFVKEAEKTFGKNDAFELHNFEANISQNAISMRRQIFIAYLMSNIDENEIMSIMENFLEDKLGSNNDYRTFLPLYEVPLIRVGMRTFKSQLQLSDKLGLNRNTLRKKIAENREFGLDI